LSIEKLLKKKPYLEEFLGEPDLQESEKDLLKEVFGEEEN
jgi:hypothetical protein